MDCQVNPSSLLAENEQDDKMEEMHLPMTTTSPAQPTFFCIPAYNSPNLATLIGRVMKFEETSQTRVVFPTSGMSGNSTPSTKYYLTRILHHWGPTLTMYCLIISVVHISGLCREFPLWLGRNGCIGICLRENIVNSSILLCLFSSLAGPRTSDHIVHNIIFSRSEV